MSRKSKLSIVGPSPSALADGQVVASVHQLLSDARVMLADEMTNLAALREGAEDGEDGDLERSTQLTKNAAARTETLLKLLKAAQLVNELTTAAQRDLVGGKDLSQMTVPQMQALLAGSAATEPKAGEGEERPMDAALGAL